ncbi:aldehyde dehydrogenase [Paenibacillus sp. N3.4]|uniref:aldehyde dehydrogenase family protein n=1 Tax=Paenibacillus sp. N3.4 TaxID=2603222 RepID=UPI0011CA6AFB|nr:aldehyde dehydrogenase family protein [Paenibacillus sp. N3.4]TXK77187.1 aldehyde dehydrogenase [Paenibacillus sp. N3.4]
MKMLIGGERKDAGNGNVIEVLNSATQELIDTVPSATKEDVLKVIDIAQEGKRAWGELPLYERSRILSRCADAIEANLEELAVMLSTEMGKIITEARKEIAVAAQIFRGFVEKANHLYGETMPDFQPGSEKDIIFTRKEPLGVIACIVPFNYPVELCAHKVAPALAAGNAVIIKPPSDNPLAVMRMAELLIENGVPGSAVQVVTGSGAVIGDLLSTSEKIDAISLTGSTEVGINVARNAAQTLKRVFLELGGNDPFIVFADADMDLAVREAASGRIQNAGQTCCAPKRFIIHRSIREAFVEKLIDLLSTVKAGDPLNDATEMGSLISLRASDEVQKQIELTVGQGATCIHGGKRIDRTFFEPTVLVNVTANMDVAKDLEIFGPVFPIIDFETTEEALSIANGSIYGLQGGVMTTDMKKAIHTASKLQCGSVIINGSGNYRTADMPFGGYKKSGLGREGITCTLDEMTQTKSYVMKGILA